MHIIAVESTYKYTSIIYYAFVENGTLLHCNIMSYKAAKMENRLTFVFLDYLLLILGSDGSLLFMLPSSFKRKNDDVNGKTHSALPNALGTPETNEKCSANLWME